MTSEILKSTNHKCRAYMEFIGLQTAGIASIITTTQQGGRQTFSMSEMPFASQVVLSVYQGGLRNRTSPANVKELFKAEALPALARIFPDVDTKFTGKILLLFREGTVQDIELTTH